MHGNCWNILQEAVVNFFGDICNKLGDQADQVIFQTLSLFTLIDLTDISTDSSCVCVIFFQISLHRHSLLIPPFYHLLVLLDPHF